jgi:hypothetical protein
MELLVTWRHFLHKVISDCISGRYLRFQFSIIRVEILNNRFFTWLVVNDSSSHFCLESHSHHQSTGLGLFWIFRIEFLNFDRGLVFLWKSNNLHGVLEKLWILQRNLETTLSKGIFFLGSSILELSGQFFKLSFALNSFGS